MMHWLSLDWWRYLLAKREWGAPSWAVVIWCRARGHPSGVVWYNFNGLEPDMTCKNCGDDLS